MKTLTIDLAERSYNIYIKEGLLKTFKLADNLRYPRRLVVTNRTIYALHADRILSLVEGNRDYVFILEDGEEYKNFESFEAIHTRLLELEFTRSSTLIAFGGGVIGDLVGFVASTYQRGIDFVQIPTTLLAQVDSSVGGKTAINHPLGKNMVGTFYQPKMVLIDLSLLKTLPQREYISGLAEVIKYGFIRSNEFLIWLEENREGILNLDGEVVAEMIYRSCAFKKAVVDEDEFESGVRAILNLGHTFGHGIERGMNYRGILHGEAVSIGMEMAGYLSYRAGFITKSDQLYMSALMDSFGLPLSSPVEIEAEKMLSYMRLDKKNRSGKIRFVLLKALGEAILTEDVEEEHVVEAIELGMP